MPGHRRTISSSRAALFVNQFTTWITINNTISFTPRRTAMIGRQCFWGITTFGFRDGPWIIC
jgi:hypothetical protein